MTAWRLDPPRATRPQAAAAAPAPCGCAARWRCPRRARSRAARRRRWSSRARTSRAPGHAPPARRRDVHRPAVALVQVQRRGAQAQAGHQDGRHRHQGDDGAVGVQPQAQRGALVAAEQALDARQRDRVDVPGVAAEEAHVLQPAVVGGVEAVVHGRGQAQRDVHAVAVALAVGAGLRGVAQQVLDAVGEALGLEHRRALHRAAGADDGVAGAQQGLRVRVQRPRAGLERAREAGLQAVEVLCLGLRQVEVGEQPPDGDRQPGQPRAADAADAAHQARQCLTRHAVGEQEVQVLLQQQAAVPGQRPRGRRAHWRGFHRLVNGLRFHCGLHSCVHP
jgi:hypothetical protein